METHEQAEFFQLLDDTCDAISMRQPLSAGAKAIMWEDLEQFPFNLVRAALQAHRRDEDRGQWQPSTAHIEYQINRRRKHQWIEADEAFAQMTFDESQPLLLNQVTAAALAAAAPFMEGRRPDQNAARMAFRATYNRLMEQEKLARRQPNYWISPAGTQDAREALQTEAVRLGYLNTQGKQFQLPAAAPALPYNAAPAGALEQIHAFKPKAIPAPEPEDYRS